MARRHSLLVRLLASSVLIAACSITATAWLAAQSTTGSIQSEFGQALANDAKIYDSLLGYAATHRGWTGVQATVDELARQTGRRIALTTESRGPIADSARSRRPPLPVNQTAVVDPLAVDLTLKPGSSTDRIDPRAVGPYLLPEDERELLLQRLDKFAICARAEGVEVRIVNRLSGRPAVDEDGESEFLTERCGSRPWTYPTKTEIRANVKLVNLANTCLVRQGHTALPRIEKRFTGPVELVQSFRSLPGWDCLNSARREQLAPHVAPAALLFLTSPGGGGTPRPDLSTAGTMRIGLTALAVLAVTLCVATFAATRLVRPIHALTSAARRMGDGDRTVRVNGGTKGELGQLAEAFNAMSEHLEKTERQRRAMVSDIAHELRTPLGNIRGWLEAAQDGVAAVEPALISSLLEEAVLLQYLVDDLQDLALADAGKLRLHPELIDAGDVVHQVAAAHRGRAEAGGVTLRAEVDGDLELTADPARLRQALGNLVSNAVRYTPRGGEVTIVGRRHTGHVLLEVADTGPGISPEDLTRVFDRFWRADRSRSRQTGGSGLGLAIARHLVEAHGGSASATSVLGQGSTFRLLLPLDAPAEGGTGIPAVPGHRPGRRATAADDRPTAGVDGRRGDPGLSSEAGQEHERRGERAADHDESEQPGGEPDQPEHRAHAGHE
jgi:two-component system sensor histidine kinase BaeS